MRVGEPCPICLQPGGPHVDAKQATCCFECGQIWKAQRVKERHEARYRAGLAAMNVDRPAPVRDSGISERVSENTRPSAWTDEPVAPAPTRPAPPPEPEEPADEGLRARCNSLLRQLSTAKASKAELVAAVGRAAADALAALSLKPVPPPAADRRTATPEVALAVLSDWQLGKMTPTYSSLVCEQRIEEYAEKVATMTAIQRADHPVREIRVYLLGDIVEGEQIFPGQSWRVDSSLFQQTCVDGPRILGSFLRSMLALFDKVRVVGVIGNHGSMGGRARKEYHPETNADAMVYEITRMMFQGEPRIEWEPTRENLERKWYAIDKVGTKKVFLFHGDQVKGGFAGFPWYGFGKKLTGWRTLADMIGKGLISDTFHYAFSGHFHTPVRLYVNGITLWGSGSTESANTYAAEELSSAGEPSQWLLYCHPTKGITAEYLVHLDEDKAA